MELETVFYILAIVYMIIMLLISFALLSAVIVIKTKINRAHQVIDQKVGQYRALTTKATVALYTIKYFMNSRR